MKSYGTLAMHPEKVRFWNFPKLQILHGGRRLGREVNQTNSGHGMSRCSNSIGSMKDVRLAFNPNWMINCERLEVAAKSQWCPSYDFHFVWVNQISHVSNKNGCQFDMITDDVIQSTKANWSVAHLWWSTCNWQLYLKWLSFRKLIINYWVTHLSRFKGYSWSYNTTFRAKSGSEIAYHWLGRKS